jgi:DNA-binding MarR family transcriptional regulator
MSGARRTREGELATQAILSIFRANGLLLAAGDELAAPEGLNSARWQVLGALALSDRPLTVPAIARRMGLTRQSVHATVRRLVDDGLLEVGANADHRRSALVSLTPAGRSTYDALDEHQAAWVHELVAGIAPKDLEGAVRVLDELARRLEAAR